VVQPFLSLITRIGLDHEQYLGDSLASIAREKAGIMRPSRLTLIAPQKEVVRETLEQEAARRGAQLESVQLNQVRIVSHRNGRYRFQYLDFDVQLEVLGAFQTVNAILAACAAGKIRDSLFPRLNHQAIEKGLASTRLPAVIEEIRESPRVILDGGHNPDAASMLAEFVRNHTKRPRTLVFGIMQDKNIEGVLSGLREEFDCIFLTRVNSVRAAAPTELLRYCPQGTVFESPVSAYQSALEGGSRTVVVAGSFYLAGEIFQLLEKRDPGPVEGRSRVRDSD
jgi:dihydrofolate synthase/folylpolyglutamate synthase